MQPIAIPTCNGDDRYPFETDNECPYFRSLYNNNGVSGCNCECKDYVHIALLLADRQERCQTVLQVSCAHSQE